MIGFLVVCDMTNPRILSALLLIVLMTTPLVAQPAGGDEKLLSLEVGLLGDTDEGVAARLRFRYEISTDGLRGIPYILGAVLQDGERVQTIRLGLRPDEVEELDSIVVLPEGEVTIEARLLLETEDGTPQLIAKVVRNVTVEAIGTDYVASGDDGAEAILAEGFIPETSGAVRLLPPKRDVAPNLFIVEATVRDPVKRLEFWVGGKKIMTRNAPPYRAELDLGTLPRGVEVKVVGYDRRGRFIDADAWVVNEHESPLEVRITRTDDSEGVARFKVSVQGSRAVSRVELWADERKIAVWRKEPYAIALQPSALEGVEYVRATAHAVDGLEATDLLYLSGDRYFERVDVNLVEFPVTVLDPQGRPVVGLEKSDFRVMENGAPVELSQFGFSADLPLSVGVLVDQSGSMREKIKEAKQAAVGFLENVMKEGDRGFIGGFAWDTQGLTPLVADVASLRLQVSGLEQAEGGTALYDAIVSGLYRFRNVEGRKALVIVTDGDDTASRISQDDMIKYVRASRVPLYFIGIGLSRFDFMTNSKLRNLSAETGGVTFFIGDVDELDHAYSAIEAELRTQYLLGYYTESDGKDDSYRTIEVSVPGREVSIRAIRGYIP